MTIMQYRPLVRKIARKYAWGMGNALDLDDLIQAGMLGVLRGVELFDVALGVPEWGYLHFFARRYIQQEIDAHGGTVRRPRRHARNTLRVRSLDEEIRGDKGGAGDAITLLDTIAAPMARGPEPLFGSAVATLKPPELDMVRRILSGETVIEISESIGVSRQCAHNRLHRARRKLLAVAR